MKSEKDIKEASRKLSFLENQRSHWDEMNKKITRYMAPHRGSYADERPDQDKDRYWYILNESVALACRVAVAGMKWGLSDPSSVWFNVGIEDKDLEGFAPVKDWLNEVRRRFQWILHRSNFYAALDALYEEEIQFGQAVQVPVRDMETMVHFYNVTAGQYALAMNGKEEITTLGRRFYQTAQQLKEYVEQFGGKLPHKIREIYDKNPYEWIEVGHLIEPNPATDSRYIGNRAMPWKSAYWSIQHSEPIHLSGFSITPFLAPRWSQVGQEIYGRGVGNMMLGSSIGLQEMEEESLKAVYRWVSPPLQGPHDYVTGGVDLSGETLNEIPAEGTSKIESIYNVSFDIQGVEAKAQQIVQRINHAYFNDLFLFLMQNPQATATEILERKTEKMVLLGPVVSRQQTEYFDPLFEILYHELLMNGALPPAPPELGDQDLRIEYISQLAIAQKMAQSEGIERYQDFITRAAQLNESVIDKYDVDEAADEVADMYGVPAKINRGKKETQEVRQAKAEAAAQLQKEEQGEKLLSGAKMMSEIDTSKKSALTDLLGGRA